MTLQPGTRIGSYEILAPLGAGGMGEVYRARDGKLDRDVAVKVLPAHLTADPDSLARFEREAKAVAALSHPNILSIFDFGSHDGVSYAVTELLQGETLRGKLDGSTVTQRQAVDWCCRSRGPLRRARPGGRASRPEARQRVRAQRRSRQDPRLRPREARRRRRTDQTSAPTGAAAARSPARSWARWATCRRSRSRPAGRSPQGPFLVRRDPLRAPLRPEGIPARYGERHDRRRS